MVAANSIRLPATDAQRQMLWEMSADDFNAWRRANDLPVLVDYCQNRLPGFRDWMQDFSISVDDLLDAPHTGEWFKGLNTLTFVEYLHNNEKKFEITDSVARSFDFLSKHNKIEILRRIEFLPYWAWGSIKYRSEAFYEFDPSNRQFAGSFIYCRWEGGDISKAFIFHDFEVPNLGGVLPRHVRIDARNLDFVQLDELTVEGRDRFLGNRKNIINYSSCRNLHFKDCELAFFDFSFCYVDSLHAIGTRMQDFSFFQCALYEMHLENCKVNGLSIIDCDIRAPSFTEGEISRFVFIKKTTYDRPQAEVEIYRRFRVFFADHGYRHEAQKYYYLERCSERRALWSPYLENRSKFPAMKYAGRMTDLIRGYREKKVSNRQFLSFAAGIVWFHIRVWTSPSIGPALSYKAKFLYSSAEYVSWGYGLRTKRVLASAFVLTLLFAIPYHSLGPTYKDALESIYFSASTFVTLGTNINVTTGVQKVLVVVEAFFGAAWTGLLIGAVTNRSQY